MKESSHQQVFMGTLGRATKRQQNRKQKRRRPASSPLLAAPKEGQRRRRPSSPLLAAPKEGAGQGRGGEGKGSSRHRATDGQCSSGSPRPVARANNGRRIIFLYARPT
ncbi:unnamed protein product, partial [Heterosigma akashiwo]